ncbi:TATA-binding protein-associated factor mot1 [Binucleata daphniae]
MNNLTKQFVTLLQCTNKNLKKQIALDISNSMIEYQDFIPYILKHCYKLIVSTNVDDRTAGCIILRGIRKKYIDVRYAQENESKITNARIILDEKQIQKDVESKDKEKMKIVKSNEKGNVKGNVKGNESVNVKVNERDKEQHNNKIDDKTIVCDHNTSYLTNPNNTMVDCEECSTYFDSLDKTLFLGATGKEYNTEILSITDIKKQVSKHAGIDDRFVKVNLVSENDFSKREILAMRRREKLKKKTTAQEEETATEKSIENVHDFFKHLYDDLEHKEWHRRDGAFGAFIEILGVVEDEVIDNEDTLQESIMLQEDMLQESIMLQEDAIQKDLARENILSEYSERDNHNAEKINNSTTHETDNTKHTTINETEKKSYYKNPNTIIFYVPKNIIQKSFQVLYSDKLVDFICDQISMPVREKVAKLIQILFKVDENKILNTLVLFMKNSDWQIQCGSIFTIHNILQKNEIQKKYQIIISDILSNLLLSTDEDIKNFCADVLCYLPIQNYNVVLKNCWKSIEDANEIAIGKKNILRLVTKIYQENMNRNVQSDDKNIESDVQNIESNVKNIESDVQNIESDVINIQSNDKIIQSDVKIIESNVKNIKNCFNFTTQTYNLQKLIFCFRSSLYDVKLSVLEMVESVYKFMNENEKLYILRCVIENILLEENTQLRMKSVSIYKTILQDNIKHSNTIKHYLNVISSNIEDEYNTDDFIWKGEELMFSKSGIKLIGRNEVMNGRVLYIKEIYKMYTCKTNDSGKDQNVKENSIQENNNHNIHTMKDNSMRTTNFAFLDDFIKSSILNGTQTRNIYKLIFCYILKGNSSSEFDMSLYFTPKVYSEIQRKEKNHKYSSTYPSFTNYYVDYLRLKVFVCNFRTKDIKKLYENEENEEYLELMSEIVMMNTRNESEHMIEYVIYDIITNEHEGNNESIIEHDNSNSVTNSNDKTNKNAISSVVKKEFNFNVNTFFNAKIEKKCFASVFFKNYSIKKNKKLYEFVKKDERRVKFFREVLKYYCCDEKKKDYDFIFYEAIQTCMKDTRNKKYDLCVDIIKMFIVTNRYEEYLVKVLMNDLNVKLLKEVIENIKPSFYFLFPRRLLRIINSSSDNKNDSELASYCFSYIVPYLSLKSINKSISNELKNEIKKKCKEIEELFDIKKEYVIECESDVKLRDYQKKGLSWMSFMKEVGVNGVLADDMGLGKTIMVLSFISNEIHKRKHSNINTSNVVDANNVVDTSNTPQQSLTNNSSANNSSINNSDHDLCSVTRVLILTPSSLTGHWEDEIKKKYKNLKASIYTKKEKKMKEITIVSFDLFRNEYTNFIGTYFYIIIDEGHVLKNRDTILYSRVMLLKSHHKLILTGTPIHNSVEDLFSLFNFLMPNYLGNEKEFVNFYVKPINQARESKATERDIEKSEKKIKELHKKVLPFIMRRLKSDVLKDLPPKIVTDILIDMDEEEMCAYEKVNDKDRYKDNNIVGDIKALNDKVGETKTINDDTSSGCNNVRPGYKDLSKSGFKKMGESLRICSHKKYIQNNECGSTKHSNENVKKYKRSSIGSNLDTATGELYSSKVKALIDIINLCGGENMKNKILVFCQYKTTIDFVLKDLKCMPYLKYQRIDGSVKSEMRNKIAQEFNDGDYHIMFLTTQVGGLGLNLTGADTVIMYEHDWNPFNDLQAMDRAHRIGQKRTVNVYRLITKNTIEERVMNLQNFKVHVAGSIVTQQNTEAGSMEIGDVFERFERR